MLLCHRATAALNSGVPKIITIIGDFKKCKLVRQLHLVPNIVNKITDVIYTSIDILTALYNIKLFNINKTIL